MYKSNDGLLHFFVASSAGIIPVIALLINCGGLPQTQPPNANEGSGEDLMNRGGDLFFQDDNGQLVRIANEEGESFRKPAPGTDDLATPSSRAKLLQSRVPQSTIAASFRGTATVLYTVLNVPIFCVDDEVCARKLASPFPDFYQPTWREYFNAIARSAGTHWEFTTGWKESFEISRKTSAGFEVVSEQRDGFLFSEPAMPLPFEIDVARGWRVELRDGYVAYIPPQAPVGMDIYFAGEYSPNDPDLYNRVRDYWAMLFASKLDPNVSTNDMKETSVANSEALFWEFVNDLPNRRIHWRQWVFVKDSFGFAIVSAIDMKNEKIIWPSVEAMVASFRVVTPNLTKRGVQ